MPPNRHLIKEAKRQFVPDDLLNTHWTLESWNNQEQDCTLNMNFYAKGRFTFRWNDLDFDGNNLWYLVKGPAITFHTRPIEKIVWTTEKHELKPDNFTLYLREITNYRVDDNRLILTSPDQTFVLKRI